MIGGIPPGDRDAAGKAAEAMVLRQLLSTSGVFKRSGPGAEVYADMFTSALADAVAQGGGLGLSSLLLPEDPHGAGANDDPGALRGLETLRALGLEGRVGRHTASLGAPVAGGEARMTSAFGVRADPFTGEARKHRGLDFAAPEGTPILAAAPGKVVFAGERGGYGLAVEVEHAGGMRTLYAHASSVGVQVGQEVRKGEVIAAVGSTGRSTGAHLHFEVRQDGRPVDPQFALKTYARRAEEHSGSGSGAPHRRSK